MPADVKKRVLLLGAGLSVLTAAACSPTARLVAGSDEAKGAPPAAPWGVVEYRAGSALEWLTAARRQDARKIMRLFCHPRNFRVVERKRQESPVPKVALRFECAGSLSQRENDEYWTLRFQEEVAAEELILSRPD